MARFEDSVEEQNSLEAEARKFIKSKRDMSYALSMYQRRHRAGGAAIDSKIHNIATRLVAAFPDLAGRRIAAILGVSEASVRRIKGEVVPAMVGVVPYDEQDTDQRHASHVTMTNNELAALRATGCAGYENDPRAKFEDKFASGPVLVSDRAHYKADQSHTIKRPITLPTKPFDIAA